MEKSHQLLAAIIAMRVNSETGGDFPPSVLNNIGDFTRCIACAELFFLSLTMVVQNTS
jgi:hypothetical protein